MDKMTKILVSGSSELRGIFNSLGNKKKYKEVEVKESKPKQDKKSTKNTKKK